MAGVSESQRSCQNPRCREGGLGQGWGSEAGRGLDVVGGNEKREGGSTDFHVGNWGMWGDGRVGRRGWRRKGCEELERIISK